MSTITWVKDSSAFTLGKIGNLPVFMIEDNTFSNQAEPFELCCELLGKIHRQFKTEQQAQAYAEKRLERFMYHTGLVFGEVQL